MDSSRLKSYKETTKVEKILNDKASEQLVTQNRNEFSKIESGQKRTVRGGNLGGPENGRPKTKLNHELNGS